MKNSGRPPNNDVLRNFILHPCGTETEVFRGRSGWRGDPSELGSWKAPAGNVEASPAAGQPEVGQAAFFGWHSLSGVACAKDLVCGVEDALGRAFTKRLALAP